MARRHSRPEPVASLTLQTLAQQCSSCGGRLRADYRSHRTIVTLEGLLGLDVQVRRCPSEACTLFRVPIHAEAEGRLVLPHHEFSLEVMALVGALRHAEHRSVPEIHAALRARDVDLAERTVTHLLHRYDELLALSLTDTQRLRRLARRQGHVVLALDGLQPDVGHEVLWVVRDCVSGEILTARTMLSAREAELAPMLTEVRRAVKVPIVGVVSDGQRSIRNAVASALPGVPHQLCHFHYLREAGRPVFEADRHAKKLLKARVRGVRPIERAVEGKDDPISRAVQGYCVAVRSALTDDGLPPLAASGIKLRRRLMGIRASLQKVSRKGGDLSIEFTRLTRLLDKALRETASMWPAIERAYRRVHRIAHLLTHPERRRARGMRRAMESLLHGMTRSLPAAGALREALEHFLKMTRSYWDGLFHCYDVPDLPATNNALEQLFGAYRHHERRVRGQKVASASLVVRGKVRIVAATATRLRRPKGEELAPTDLAAWRALRREMEGRQGLRVLGRRYRREPRTYLRRLESL